MSRFSFSGYGLNRTYCDVLQEMRDLLKADTQLHTVAPIVRSLVEELQVYGNRMEASLSDIYDIECLHIEINKLKEELKSLEEGKKKYE